MQRLLPLLALVVCLVESWGNAATLAGTVTDPSGAAIGGATVQLRGSSGERRAKTGKSGRYEITTLPAGEYETTISAKGFAPARKRLAITGATMFDAQLAILPVRSTVSIGDGAGRSLCSARCQ